MGMNSTSMLSWCYAGVAGAGPGGGVEADPRPKLSVTSVGVISTSGGLNPQPPPAGKLNTDSNVKSPSASSTKFPPLCVHYGKSLFTRKTGSIVLTAESNQWTTNVYVNVSVKSSSNNYREDPTFICQADNRNGKMTSYD